MWSGGAEVVVCCSCFIILCMYISAPSGGLSSSVLCSFSGELCPVLPLGDCVLCSPSGKLCSLFSLWETVFSVLPLGNSVLPLGNSDVNHKVRCCV